MCLLKCFALLLGINIPNRSSQMNEFFSLTTNLSPHTKWILIRLITGRIIGDEVSKNDLIKLGCPHNKFKKVLEELQEINAISKLGSEHLKRGRPTLSYSFIYDKPNDVSKLISSEMLAKLEKFKLRVPVRLVWSFFALNQDEHGYIEGFTMASIAKACGLESPQLKTAIKLLKNGNLISQPVTGCTIKKYHSLKPKVRKGLVGSEANNLKRSSVFKIKKGNKASNIYLMVIPLIISQIKNKKPNLYTAVFLPLLLDSPHRRESLFMELLRLENKWLDSDTKQKDEIQFLKQQPTQVFDYFDDVLFRLASYGLLRLLNKTGHVLKPISEEDAFNQILSPANFEFMAAIHGRLTSVLIGSFANILIHYILFNLYQNRCDITLPTTPSKQEYLSWVTSLGCTDKNIDIELIKTPTKAVLPDISSIENLVISSSIDFSDKVNITNIDVDFIDPKSNLKSSQHPVFQCVHDSFAHFYKSVITSEQL